MTMANASISSPQRTGASLRKTNKPLMEKRRRARINDSLTQLKSLVIQSSKKDSSQFNKLEKADILELTVKYLRNLQEQQQQQQLSQPLREASLTGKYQAGFMECANEVIRYLGQSQGFGDDVKSRVVHHLASCIQLSSKMPVTKPAGVSGGTVIMNSSNTPTGLRPTSGQVVNGQVIHIINGQIQNMKASSFPVIQPSSAAPTTSASAPTRISVPIVPVPASSALTPEATNYTRYTQPLQIQIPTVVSPILVQSKPGHHLKISQSQVENNAAHLISQMASNKQETFVSSNSPPPHLRERSRSPLPIRMCQKPQRYYSQDEQCCDPIPRSRTYSVTSSVSSESEMSSPLNLSQSPHYYDRREINNNKYPSPVNSHYTSTPYQYDRISATSPSSRDGLYLSQCPSSNFASVIVDGRKTGDGHAFKYLQFIDEEKQFVPHERSASPASSVGDDRLWRPW